MNQTDFHYGHVVGDIWKVKFTNLILLHCNIITEQLKPCLQLK